MGLKQLFLQIRLRGERKRAISMLLKSRMISEGTESGTLIRMADEIRRYIKSGEYGKGSLPNGYRSATQ